jgi:aspartate/methionine/tyrosine aminotransferase
MDRIDFSKRGCSFEGIPNALYREKAAIIRAQTSRKSRKARCPFFDFVSANVGEHGISYPQSVLKKAFSLATSDAKVYRPDPQGQLVARLAIQQYYE